jgi:hypothetical protein
MYFYLPNITDIPRTKSHVHFLSLRSFVQGIRLGPRPLMNVRNKLIFYGEKLLAPRPTHKLEDHSLSITGGRLLHPQPEDEPCRGDKGPA